MGEKWGKGRERTKTEDNNINADDDTTKGNPAREEVGDAAEDHAASYDEVDDAAIDTVSCLFWSSSPVLSWIEGMEKISYNASE